MNEINIIIQGDCIEEMKKLPDNSVDAVITDAPYGLKFMGKDWDKFSNREPRMINDLSSMNSFQQFCFEWASECLRVLKHGGYLLSFGGTRTYHRMTCGIEDAGFEIRDCIMWLYGSGFPKSLNIGKQIDKIQGNEREVIGISEGKGYSSQQEKNKEEGFRLYKKGLPFEYADRTLTKGSSEWEGWGTALKPAVEPIVVARKPLSEKNVALNVLKWGTGGINIDESRIGIGKRTIPIHSDDRKEDETMFGLHPTIQHKRIEINQGRFPANIILDEEAEQMLDEQSGESKSKGGQSFSKTSDIYGEYSNDRTIKGCGFNDIGGASRFFYCAKASKSERNDGCEELEKGCNHPTVKPLALMEYLIKLVTRENAVVLDCFLGSGTTAIACLKTNRKFIGIEKEEEYVKIAQARIKPYLEQRKL